MHTRTLSVFSLLSTLLLLGAGCVTTEPITNLPNTPPAAEVMPNTNNETMTEGAKKDDAMMTDDERAMKKTTPASYRAYSDDAYTAARAAGQPIALYFWAAWCPICKAEEPGVKETIEQSDTPVAGFRVNYDTETALKTQYRIPYQHTLVILDRNGNESARFTGPVSAEVLTEALRQAAN